MGLFSKIVNSTFQSAKVAALRNVSSAVSSSISRATGGRVRVSLNLAKRPTGRRR